MDVDVGVVLEGCFWDTMNTPESLVEHPTMFPDRVDIYCEGGAFWLTSVCTLGVGLTADERARNAHCEATILRRASPGWEILCVME